MIVAVVGGCITSVVGLVTIWGWVSAPAAKLSATIKYVGTYWYPPGGEGRPESGDLRYFWHATVQNEGDLKVSSVTLRLPRTVIAQVYKTDRDYEERQVENDVIAIGDLEPERKIDVIAWTRIPITSLDADSVRLRHAGGTGTVIVSSPVGPFWVWLSRYWFLVVLVVALGLMLLALAYREEMSNRQ